MTDNELLLAIYSNIQTMQGDLASVKGDVEAVKTDLVSVKDDVESVTGDIETVKIEIKHLRRETIKMQAMDEAILDEVERVHHILIDHKADKTVHTA